MIEFTMVRKPSELCDLTLHLNSGFTDAIAMDFEEESNLHVYGEHLCIIQIFDSRDYYIIDALELAKTEDGVKALGEFFSSPIQKIMFDCSSDAAIVRKTLGLQIRNVYDIRLVALALGFTGNLTGLIERNLSVAPDDPESKKKYQKANWYRRPIPESQLEYALGDVRYLFDLKASLLEEAKGLTKTELHQIEVAMRGCASPKHKDKPGWEKICNYKALSRRQKCFVRHFFMARDALARKANVPPTNILEKQLIVAMAKSGTHEGILTGPKLRYLKEFEKARLDALEELENKN